LNEEMQFFEDENVESDLIETPELSPKSCEECLELDALKAEISAQQARIDMLTKDNAELISDNLALRAKTEELLLARSVLPEFSVKTESCEDKYSDVREAFKKRR